MLTPLLSPSEQVTGYAIAYREASYEKLSNSIRRSVAKCAAMPTPVASTQEGAGSETAAINAPTTASSGLPLVDQFKQRVLAQYGSVASAWETFDGISDAPGISRSDFKLVVSSLLKLKMTNAEKGKLRKKLDPLNTKTIREADFMSFFGDNKDKDDAAIHLQSAAKLPSLPVDMPELPDACVNLSLFSCRHILASAL